MFTARIIAIAGVLILGVAIATNPGWLVLSDPADSKSEKHRCKGDSLVCCSISYNFGWQEGFRGIDFNNRQKLRFECLEHRILGYFHGVTEKKQDLERFAEIIKKHNERVKSLPRSQVFRHWIRDRNGNVYTWEEYLKLENVTPKHNGASCQEDILPGYREEYSVDRPEVIE